MVSLPTQGSQWFCDSVKLCLWLQHLASQLKLRSSLPTSSKTFACLWEVAINSGVFFPALPMHAAFALPIKLSLT